MKKYVKEFILRGLMFSGLGPIVLAIVMLCLSRHGIEMNGTEAFKGIVSTYLLAFIIAGASVVEQIEEWSAFKAAFIHLLIIYVAYISTYLINSWIPFNSIVIAVFSICVVVCFIIIWFIAYFVSNKTRKLLNDKIGA